MVFDTVSECSYSREDQGVDRGVDSEKAKEEHKEEENITRHVFWNYILNKHVLKCKEDPRVEKRLTQDLWRPGRTVE